MTTTTSQQAFRHPVPSQIRVAIDQLVENYSQLDIDGTGDDFRDDLLEAYRISGFDDEAPSTKWLREMFEAQYHHLAANLRVDEGRITIYRAINAETDFNSHEPLRNGSLGLCWAYSENGARVYNAEVSDRRLIVGEVDMDAVDWMASIYLHTHTWNEEEVRLLPGAPVNVLEVRSPNSASDCVQRPFKA